MANRDFHIIHFVVLVAIILSMLACSISLGDQVLLGVEPSLGGESAAVTMSDFPELASFGELAAVHGSPITADVGTKAGTVDLYDGASIQIPAGAFPGSNRLGVTRVDVAFDQIAPDVSQGVFYVVRTEEDVPVLGASIILEVPGFSGDLTVVHYEGGDWVSVSVAQSSTARVSIDHFSKGIWGFFEFWSERDVALGETIDSMDYDSAQARMRLSIEGGGKWVHAFFGVNEQSHQTDKEMCDAIIALLKQYNKPSSRQFPEVQGSTKNLGEFLFAGASPEDVGGPFWEATEDSMEDINDALLTNKDPISPAEFLKIAIDANNGNIPLGVLADHNYLKNITYKGRNAYKPGSGMPREYGEPASRLRSWRQGSNITAAGEYDKMGPIYHIFAAMTGALWLPTRASGQVIAHGEAFLRTFRVGADRPDTPKASADLCGINAAAWLRSHPPEEAAAAPEGKEVTMTGKVTPTGLNPGRKVTKNTFSITFKDDGSGKVRGSGIYASIHLPDECNKELPHSTRWELTGSFDPATRQFSGTLQEFGKGEITLTNCRVIEVEEYLSGDGTWEAVLLDGRITGRIILIPSNGVPVERLTFELE